MIDVNKTVKELFILSLISPLISLYKTLRIDNWEIKKPIFILLITLFGSTIVLGTSDGDSLYGVVLEHYTDLSFNQWLYELKQTLIFSPAEGTKGDVFNHVLSYLLGSVLGFPEIYFVVVSFIYAWFFINSISIILIWDDTTKKNLIFWFLVVIFISYRFIDNIQTVRTWTGLWVLFYGVVKYYQTGKFKYLFVMLMAPLFHVAYFVMAMPAYVVVFLKRLDSRIFILIYIVSFTMNLSQGLIIDQLKTTDIGEQKVAGYYREDPDLYDFSARDQSNFYVKYGKWWSRTESPHFLAISIILFGLFSKKRMTRLEHGLFSTGILIATMANFMSFIPALYSRSMSNAAIYIIATVILLVTRGELWNTRYLNYRKTLVWISALSFVPYLFYVFSNMIQFTSIFMFALPILGINDSLNMSIREFIFYIFNI